jgi:hypothetical protein
MDILTDLSIKIAEATVPDEIDLAPLMTDAFIRGGKEKESLFAKQESAELGAFGLVDGVVLFPWILKGIAFASPFILQMLSMDNGYISTISDSLNICDKLRIKEKVTQIPEKQLKILTTIFDKFLSELKASGLPEEECNRIISNVLVTLLKDPSVSLVFVEKVAGSK